MTDKLIAYFSYSGHTKAAAEDLARVTGADLFSIEAAEPYTDDDLDWHNDKCRSMQEAADRASRPALAGVLPDLSAYKDVYIGFPIWYGIAPRVIDTFADAEESVLSGKRVALFCTSGGSPADHAGEKFSEAHPNVSVSCIKRISGPVSADIL
ncbi:MAG: flavodoxin [Tractidigestivibacter sp.]|uniref:flavodoxin n=1 Tax=Tractidigestivibacter sp. TaxID=2847320 RepID=UPI003D92548D